MNNNPIEAYPLCWPDDRKRAKYRVNSAFSGSFDAVRRGVCDELDRLGAINVIISTNLPLRADGMPRAGVQAPADPGVAVYFKYKDKQMCFACDKYFRIWENMRSIQKTIEAIRGIERWGSSDMMERAFKGFTALPEVVVENWREVLDLPREGKVTQDQLESQFRALVKVCHPDAGGDAESFHLLVLARENARKDLGLTR